MGGSGRDQTIRQPLRNFAVQGSRKWLVSGEGVGSGQGRGSFEDRKELHVFMLMGMTSRKEEK